MTPEEKKAKNRERMRKARAEKKYVQAEHSQKRTPESRYSRAKYDAQRRKSGAKEFTLTLEEYTSIVSRPCAYCNGSLAEETGSGLDRIDNEKGYIPGNVNPCCRDCNTRRAKSMSAEEFKRQSILNGYWKA